MASRQSGSGRSEPRFETLEELFDHHGIVLNDVPRPGRQHGGSRSRVWCPKCAGGNEKERNFYVAIDADGKGAAWHCFRANNCGFSGGGRLGDAPAIPQRAPKHYRRPDPPERIERPSRLVEYFQGFGISEATLGAFGIYRAERRMPVLDADGKQDPDRRDKRPVIAYPYRDQGALTNVKYKALYPGGRKRFTQEAGCEPTLYNIDRFTDAAFGIIVEGEDDVLACFEAGYPQVTTLPDGSPTKISEHYDPATDDDDRYRPLRGDPRLERLERIYLAGDMDEAGKRHHEEIARRVGKERCWLVRWPRDCKDAKETLKARGPDAVRFAIDHAEPYPLEGIHFVTDEEMANLYAGLESRRYTTGYYAIDEHISLSEEGLFLVTTGIPGHGKSSFLLAWATLLALHNEQQMQTDPLLRPFHTVIIGAEVKVRRMVADLVSQHSSKPFFPGQSARVGMDEMLTDHVPWVRKHFSFVEWPDRTTQPPISWVLERFRENIRRTGAKLGIIDPWQEFDDEMPDREQNHSRWVGKVLQRVIGTGLDLACNLALVAHPMKLRRDRDGKFPVPGGYDIGDSQNFYSRPDIGLTIHRQDFDTDEMLLRIWKTKDKRYGVVGDVKLRFDRHTTRIQPKPVDTEAQAPGGRRWYADD